MKKARSVVSSGTAIPPAFWLIASRLATLGA